MTEHNKQLDEALEKIARAIETCHVPQSRENYVEIGGGGEVVACCAWGAVVMQYSDWRKFFSIHNLLSDDDVTVIVQKLYGYDPAKIKVEMKDKILNPMLLSTIIDMNDEGKSYTEIAEWIRANMHNMHLLAW